MISRGLKPTLRWVSELTSNMANDLPTSNSLTSLRAEVAARLNVVRRALLGHFLADGVARTLVVTVGLLLLSLGLDWGLDLSLTARLIYWGVVLGSAAGVLFWFVIRPWRLPLGPIDVAAALDQKRSGPPLAPQVASVLQLVEGNSDQIGESAAMRDQAVRTSHASLAKIDLGASLNSRHLWTAAAVALAALLVPAGIALAFPGTAKLWAQRWFAGSDRPWPRSTQLEVVGVREGVLQVPRGELFSLRVKVIDQQQPTQTVHIRLRPDEGKTQTLTLEKFAVGDFRLEMPPQQQSSRVEAWGGDGRAEPFRIVPVDRPRIVRMSLIAKGPRDSEAKTYDFNASDSAVRLSPQTTAHFEFETNVECSTVKVETVSNSISGFQQECPLRHSVDWVHTEAVSLRIVLVSKESGLESHPQSVSIGELPDRAPRLSMRHSGVRLRVTPEATIPLTISVRDDFGVYQAAVNLTVPALTAVKPEEDELPLVSSKQDVKPEGDKPADPALPDATVPPAAEASLEAPAKTESAPPTTGPAPESTTPEPAATPEPPVIAQPTSQVDQILYGPASPALETQVDKEHRVELSAMKLEPGQTLVITASADDDCILGRQSTRSAPVVFRIVRAEELFREILLRQQQLRARLQKARDQADSLTTKIPFAIASEDARDLARQHQVITREVGQVTQGLEATLLEMQLNKLGGEEAWDLISTIIIKPLRALGDTELPAQRLNLESLVQAPGEGLDQISTQQQKIVADLDQILKNMAQWDSFIDIVNQVDAVIKLETRIRERTEELKKQADALRKKEADSIFDK